MTPTRVLPSRGVRLCLRHPILRPVNDRTSEITSKLIELRTEHRDLDQTIALLTAQGRCDELQLRRMKKRKLLLKDAISRLESKLIPDLDA